MSEGKREFGRDEKGRVVADMLIEMQKTKLDPEWAAIILVSAAEQYAEDCEGSSYGNKRAIFEALERRSAAASQLLDIRIPPLPPDD